MADKKQDTGFKVTDRRLFTSEGELRNDAVEAAQEPKPTTPAPAAPSSVVEIPAPTTKAPDTVTAAEPSDREMPTPPTAAEQDAQAAAYRKSSKVLDSEVELSGHSARDFEITFERFMASLYMTAMLQLGLMRQQDEQPRVDIIGARQTIDTLSLISEKTKGNLTPTEENFLQNSLYELRMAYVEVTNAIARPPQPGPATGTIGR